MTAPDLPFRCLIVEDRPADAELVLLGLGSAGVLVDPTVVDGEEGFRSALDASIDLVLADYSMPGFGALGALRILRERELDIPLIVVSGTISEEIAVECMRQGAADYLLKDRLGRLGIAVRQAIERRDAERRRREIEAALLERDRQFRAVFENALDAIIVGDDERRLIDANPAASLLLGRSRDELLQMRVEDLFPTASREAATSLWARFIAEGEQHGEISLLHADGSLRIADYRARASILPGRHLSVMRDISDRRRLEEQLSEAQKMEAIENARALERERRLRERIQQLQRAAGDLGIRHGRAAASQRAVDLAREWLRAEYAALLVRDRDEKTLFVTSGHAEATQAGLHPPAGRGLLGLDLVRGQAVRVPSVAHDPRSTGSPAGHPSLVDLLIVPVYGADRQLGQLYVANSLDGAFTDDDEQLLPTLAEHVGTMLESGALIDDLRHARAAETRLARLLDESSDEIHVLDAETLRFVQTNAGARHNLGYSEDELSGMTPADIQSEYTADAVAALVAPLRAGDRDEFRVETFQRRKDGSTYPVEVRLRMARSEDRPVFISVVRDISARQELERQLRQAQKMEAIGHLAGGIAHDFNNLLTAISGYAQLLASDLDPADERRADVDQILDASDRAARLTRQLLAFGRRQVLHPEILDLNAVVRGIDALLRPLIGDTIELTVALDPELGGVQADPSQLEQVIMNLVTNARDAMLSGGHLTIETANVELDSTYVASHPDAQAGPHVLLAVSDTGTGMDAATMARLFEPFFTTKEPGKGTGLGLATTYGIVKQSGGNIWVYSEPGVGTTFKVYLPRVDPADGPAEASARRTPEGSIGGTETILLVEDDDAVRALAETILAGYGYTVLAAPNGAVALEVANAADSIALLVTDVMMPGLRGPELAERLVALRPGLRVLYISGYAAEAVGNHDMLERGAHYLEKPFTPEALARAVRSGLDAPGLDTERGNR